MEYFWRMENGEWRMENGEWLGPLNRPEGRLKAIAPWNGGVSAKVVRGDSMQGSLYFPSNRLES
jgi:hypothetical protein